MCSCSMLISVIGALIQVVLLGLLLKLPLLLRPLLLLPLKQLHATAAIASIRPTNADNGSGTYIIIIRKMLPNAIDSE